LISGEVSRNTRKSFVFHFSFRRNHCGTNIVYVGWPVGLGAVIVSLQSKPIRSNKLMRSERPWPLSSRRKRICVVKLIRASFGVNVSNPKMGYCLGYSSLLFGRVIVFLSVAQPPYIYCYT